MILSVLCLFTALSPAQRSCLGSRSKPLRIPRGKHTTYMGFPPFGAENTAGPKLMCAARHRREPCDPGVFAAELLAMFDFL